VVEPALCVEVLALEANRVRRRRAGDVCRRALGAVSLVLVLPLSGAAGVGDVGDVPERVVLVVEARRSVGQRDGAERPLKVAADEVAGGTPLERDLGSAARG
jgi:hypothetical protein